PHVVDLPVGGPPAVKIGAVPGGDPGLDITEILARVVPEAGDLVGPADLVGTALLGGRTARVTAGGRGGRRMAPARVAARRTAGGEPDQEWQQGRPGKRSPTRRHVAQPSVSASS